MLKPWTVNAIAVLLLATCASMVAGQRLKRLPPVEPRPVKLLAFEEQTPLNPPELLPIPNDTEIDWWRGQVSQPLRPSPAPTHIDIHSLILDTLMHSATVRAIGDNVTIEETNITRARAEFDPEFFLESKLVRNSDPTGSTLDAGFNVSRLREIDWYARSGLRQKNILGGTLEASEQIGLRDSNSQFFFPDNQGNARLTLSYEQPLLNQSGRLYNTSMIVLARIDSRVAEQQTMAELQNHLLSVTEAMWQIYLQRSLLIQKQRHLQRAEVILERLENRREIDSLASQIARAKAAVAMRNAELIRAAAAIRNAEARLRSLVNSPTMLDNRASELIPVQTPQRDRVPVNLESEIFTALEQRPEINAAAQEIEAARVRFRMARNELLPVLDFVLETYVSGLRGSFNVGDAYGDQFREGEPSYTAGFVFEVPLDRRAAKAKHRRRELEVRQLSSRFQAAIETLHAEVEIAVREVETSYQVIKAKQASLAAAKSDVRYLQLRWEELPGDDRSASFLLEDLLEAQDRLATEEFGLAEAEVNYTLSQTRLKRATGSLLEYEQITMVRACEGHLPTVLFERTDLLPGQSHR